MQSLELGGQAPLRQGNHHHFDAVTRIRGSLGGQAPLRQGNHHHFDAVTRSRGSLGGQDPLRQAGGARRKDPRLAFFGFRLSFSGWRYRYPAPLKINSGVFHLGIL
eukprot:528874-Prorocentrum_minimum.AAC.4